MKFFYPSSIDHFLEHVFVGSYDSDTSEQFCDNSGQSCRTVTIINPTVMMMNINSSELDSVNEDHYLIPKEPIPDNFEHGDLENISLYLEPGAPTVETPLYYRYTIDGNKLTLRYSLFFPFNVGKNVGLGYTLGSHFGDWEALTITIIDDKPIRVHAAPHGGEVVVNVSYGNPKLQTIDGHVIMYIAKGSHGYYAQAKNTTYFLLPWPLRSLQDITADGGHVWNTWENLQEYDSQFRGHWGAKAGHRGGAGRSERMGSVFGYEILDSPPYG